MTLIQEKNEVTQEIINAEEDAVETLTNSDENGTIVTSIQFDEVNFIRKLKSISIYSMLHNSGK